MHSMYSGGNAPLQSKFIFEEVRSKFTPDEVRVLTMLCPFCFHLGVTICSMQIDSLTLSGNSAYLGHPAWEQ